MAFRTSHGGRDFRNESRFVNWLDKKRNEERRVEEPRAPERSQVSERDQYLASPEGQALQKTFRKNLGV